MSEAPQPKKVNSKQFVENYQEINWGSKEKPQYKKCPHCGSNNIIIFDADNDICQNCQKWFPAL